MQTSKELLSSILKTTQMGQIGIRSVLDSTVNPGLRNALESQLQEYDSIETEAHAISSQRDWNLKELNPAVRKMSDMMVKMKLNGKNQDSKIAEMMIEGNTKGMIKSLKNLHHFSEQDGRVVQLTQKLLDTETVNIRQMEGFL